MLVMLLRLACCFMVLDALTQAACCWTLEYVEYCGRRLVGGTVVAWTLAWSSNWNHLECWKLGLAGNHWSWRLESKEWSSPSSFFRASTL